MTRHNEPSRLTRFSRAARSVLSLNRPRDYQHLLRMLDVRRGDRVLDVGSGDGFWTARFAAHCRQIVGLEPDQELRGLAEHLHPAPNLSYVNGVAESLPFPSATFDKVVSVSCLEHFRDPAAGLLEMIRVLKPGGRLAISVDSLLAENSPLEFRAWHKQRHFVTTYFTAQQLLGLMTRSGMRCEPDRTIHLFRSRAAARVRQLFIPRPAMWMPLFPVLYAVAVVADRVASDTHGQIIIVTGTQSRVGADT